MSDALEQLARRIRALEAAEHGTGGISLGNVIGPTGAVNNNFASFNGPSGLIIKDSGYSASSFSSSAHTHTDKLNVDASNDPITGPLDVRPAADTINALRVLTSAGAQVFRADTLNDLIEGRLNESWVQETKYLVVDSSGRGDYTTIGAAITHIEAVCAIHDVWTIILRTPTTESVTFNPGAGNYDVQVHIHGFANQQITGSVSSGTYGYLYLHGLRVYFASAGTDETLMSTNGNTLYAYNCDLRRSGNGGTSVINPRGGTIELHHCHVEQLTSVNTQPAVYSNGTTYVYDCDIVDRSSWAFVVTPAGGIARLYRSLFSQLGTATNAFMAGGNTLEIFRCQYDTALISDAVVLPGDSVPSVPLLHNVLDSTKHSDVLTGSIARGDVLYGNATSKIARLVKGSAFAVLTGDGTDTAWSTFLLSGTAGGKTIFNVSNTKVLTLTAADTYTLTIPATGTVALLGANNAFTGSNTFKGIKTIDSNLLQFQVLGDVTPRYQMGAGGAGGFFFQSLDAITPRAFAIVSSGGIDKFAVDFETGNTRFTGTATFNSTCRATAGAELDYSITYVKNLITRSSGSSASPNSAWFNFKSLDVGGPLISLFNSSDVEIGRIASNGNAMFGTTTDGMTSGGSVAVAKDLAHRGSKAGFFNIAPASRPTAYTQTYATASKTVPNMTYAAPVGGATVDTEGRASLAQLAADVLAYLQVITAMIDDGQSLGLLQ